jgi:hypothetical protein
VAQAAQQKNKNCVVTFENNEGVQMLSDLAKSTEGLSTGDGDRFLRTFWELSALTDQWEFFHVTTDDTVDFGGMAEIVFWEKGQGELSRSPQARIQGHSAWQKRGVLLSRMNRFKCTLYCGDLYDKMAVVLVPNSTSHLPALWSFCCSEDYHDAVRAVSQNVAVATSTMAQVPFDLEHWQRVAAKKYPKGLPTPSSNDSTQWLFAGHPVDSTSPLQVGVARLLGYRWPRQTGQTVSGAPLVPNDGLEKFVDEDGIVCIPSVRGEQPAADRLRELLIKAYGKTWSPAQQDELLAAVGFEARTLEDWLRNGFFEQHCKFFHHRPFIWQIWDGRKDGFSALVNYHKLDHKLLEKLTYTYLGEWIKKQQDAVASEESGADDRLLKARELQDRLKLILEGEAPYDIFVRWKPPEQQPIGWHPDPNDGVRLNIRPFMEADVLRKRPNIKWGIDRGKNPPGSPWGEERDNDRHLTLQEKQKARR